MARRSRGLQRMGAGAVLAHVIRTALTVVGAGRVIGLGAEGLLGRLWVAMLTLIRRIGRSAVVALLIDQALARLNGMGALAVGTNVIGAREIIRSAGGVVRSVLELCFGLIGEAGFTLILRVAVIGVIAPPVDQALTILDRMLTGV